DHGASAFLTGDAGFNRLDGVALGVDVFGVAALRVAGTRQERTARPFAEHHGFAALVTDMLSRPARQDRLALGVEVHGRAALGGAAATQKRSTRTHALDHRLAARRTFVLGKHGRLTAIAVGRLRVSAFRVARASQELTASLFAVADHERFATLWTL